MLGLPRGGVPVAYEVARALDAPLDVIVARKIGAPADPEMGLGAVAEDGVRVFNAAALAWPGLTAEELERRARGAADEVDRRIALYRGCGRAIPLAGRTAIVVDDGLATGRDGARGAARRRHRRPRTIVLAAPVGARHDGRRAGPRGRPRVCLATPERLGAIAECYDDFDQASDADVIRLLLARQREYRTGRDPADVHREARPSADAR